MMLSMTQDRLQLFQKWIIFAPTYKPEGEKLEQKNEERNCQSNQDDDKLQIQSC